MLCPSCEHEGGGGVTCAACGGILPVAGDTDRFARLGLPRRYAVDMAVLEQCYRDLSRKIHPDRFAKADAHTRRLSLQATTAVNDAYRTLRTPLSRAEYLLELEGMRIGENDRVGGEFLMDILELREGLDEARAAGDAPRVAALAAEVHARRDTSFRTVEELFARYDGGDRGVLGAIRAELITLRYYDRFLEEHEGTD